MYTIEPAIHGGYIVKKSVSGTSWPLLFAGGMADCLAFIKAALETTAGK